MVSSYPVSFDVDFPARPLDRVSTAFRIFAAIPICIVLALLTPDTVQNVRTQPATSALALESCSSHWW